jgi:hypothetical protein
MLIRSPSDDQETVGKAIDAPIAKRRASSALSLLDAPA